MQLYQWDQIEKEQLNPSFARQVIHGETLTAARVFIQKGYTVPTHSHVNEQLSFIESGHLKFVLEGKDVVVGPGQLLLIPPHVPHSAEALDDVVGIDYFTPVREDWRNGSDAYLRK